MVECIKRYCIILLLRICGFGNLLRNEKKKRKFEFFCGFGDEDFVMFVCNSKD